MTFEANAAEPRLAERHQLRRCLLTVADLLAEGGHVLETISLPSCGLAKREMKALEARGTGWSVCRKTLEASAAAGINPEGRFVLTALGREVLFDLFGQGAADCA
ncbi:hypothetical protein [Vreelandella malpeensis]|uniref:Transcriptional regulator n=1 Tax=Vreelandella malpeensis TaxID=1172368 RepID=A0ABS8DPE6_9GAMM|nr:hypothetical protein [Halomonas malpeensis]MCB8888164.1 hypothetical protein [Halomonas malpeensis]